MREFGSGHRPVSQLVEFLCELPLFSSVSLDTVESLVKRLHPFDASAGTAVMHQGEQGDALYIVASGRLEAFDESSGCVLGEITPGEIVGETALLTDEPRGATVRAVVDSRGYALSKDEFLRLLQEYPEEMKGIAELITRRASGPVREQYRPSHDEIVDFLRTVALFSSLSDTVLGELAPHLQWFALPRGEVLLRQGEIGEQLYVVVSGRLRFDIHDAGGALIRTGRIERRDVVGELSILTEETRSATVSATRDCGLLTLTARTFNQLMNRYPAVVLGITRILATRLHTQSHGGSRHNTGTTAIIPIHPGISTEEFVREFAAGPATSSTVRTISVRDMHPTFDGTEGTARWNARFRAWLSNQEDAVDHLILCGVAGEDRWNDLCVRHADRIVLLLSPSEIPDLTPFELKYLGSAETDGTVPRELVFCRSGGEVQPGTIARFRIRRVHLRFHHVRDMRREDIRRVARFVNRSAVGVALGGGGARGLAHIGAIRALREAGIPIDAVAGTSIGALIGAAVAMEYGYEEMYDAARRNLVTERPFLDPGLPLVALLRGRKMSRGLQRFFGERRIEELPIRYSAMATDLVARDLVPLDQGPIWKAVRSSASLPGLLPPVHDGDRLLVDGGLLDNAPTQALRDYGVGTTILFDVSGNLGGLNGAYDDAYEGVAIGEAPGLGSYRRHRRSHRGKTTGFNRRWPGIGEILINAMIVGSARHNRVAGDRADYYLRFPVEAYTMLGFQSLDELVALGYEETIESALSWSAGIGATPDVDS